MRTKAIIYLIILLVISLAGCSVLFFQWKNERAGRIRNQANTEILAQQKNELRYKKDSTEAQNRVLQTTVSEFKHSFTDIFNKLEAMNIKLQNVDQITTSQITVQNAPVKIHIRDSIDYKVDTVPLGYASYKDQWRDLEMQRLNDDLYITKDITRVPLFQVAHNEKPGTWKPKNILPWNWRKKELVQDISSENPNVKIEFSRTIKIVK